MEKESRPMSGRSITLEHQMHEDKEKITPFRAVRRKYVRKQKRIAA
jgi:hypothetical protein